MEIIKLNTRQYAKRQMTWFRGLRDVLWLDAGPDDPVEALAERALSLLDAAQ